MIYIGSFFHTTNQEEKNEKDRRHGEFILVVLAEDTETAVKRFKERIYTFRESSDFFEGKCSIFFTQLFQIESVPGQEAIMLNYSSYAGDPLMPFIGCSAPSDVADACRIYDWKENGPEIDGLRGRPFIEFPGKMRD